jgi:hypothetical protein
MRTTIKLTGIIAWAMVLGLLFTACGDNETNPDTTDTSISVTGVMLDQSSLTLSEGDNHTLIATVIPTNATNQKVSWTSDAESIASVDQNGKVSAIVAGEATITVTTEDGDYVADCTVTVNPIPTSIAITGQPDKTSYRAGEALDLTGLEVTVTYSDDTTGTVTITAAHITGFDNTQVGEQELTITYGGKTAPFTVTVRPFTTIVEISEYLATLPENTTDNPVILPIQFDLGDMPQAGSGWRQLLDAIADADLFVSLNLSACTMNGTVFNTGNSWDNMPDGLDNIVSITLPDVVTTIFGYAFFDCTNLVMASLPEGLTSIDTFAFRGCTNLALTALPEGLTAIGSIAFFGCTNLALTSLPDGVTSIGSYTFSGCTNLALTSLPEGVTEIGNNAFFGCTNLFLVTCHATMPPTLGTDVFMADWQGTILPDLRIEVPADSVAAYKAAANWSEYADRIFAIGE